MILPAGLLVILVILQSPQPSHAKSFFEPADDDLSPDTFKRLAAALYQRGDKAANRLTRKFLYNRNVTCNDGSPSGSNIFLQGFYIFFFKLKPRFNNTLGLG